MIFGTTRHVLEITLPAGLFAGVVLVPFIYLYFSRQWALSWGVLGIVSHNPGAISQTQPVHL